MKTNDIPRKYHWKNRNKMRKYRWGERVLPSYTADGKVINFPCPCQEKRDTRIIIHPDRMWGVENSTEGATFIGSIRCSGIWSNKECNAHYYIKNSRYVKVKEDA